MYWLHLLVISESQQLFYNYNFFAPPVCYVLQTLKKQAKGD